MRYADLDNLIADYLPEVKSDKEKTALGRILDSVSAFVDSYTKRSTILQPDGFFAPSPNDPTMKRMRGEGLLFLRLPVHVFGSITEVSCNGQVIEPACYYESEKNGWLYFEDDLFGIEEGFGAMRQWYQGQVYKVTARFGYDKTPLPIVEAVRLITVRIWETQRGTIGQVTEQGFIQERLIPTAAKDLLTPFIKREFER